MGYGNFEELLESSEAGIRKARKQLKKVYKLLKGGYNLEAMEKLKKLDIDLLNCLNDYSEEEDGKSIDGKTKIKPDWIITI